MCHENRTGSVPQSVHETMSFEENSDIEIESGKSENSSEDSCEEYTLTSEKSTINKSMSDINSD